MGLDRHFTKFLISSKQLGVNYSSTIMLGRQSLHVNEKDLADSLNDFEYKNVDAKKILSENNGYAEPFFKFLGANSIDSIDASSYEGASLIHDMNFPISDEHKGKYSVVVDGGTLEHIFNFPTAIKNCMNLVELQGHFIGSLPANNFLGHGFYQFSPELFYRIFSNENGFQIEKMIFYIDHPMATWYEIKDPLEVKERVILSNSYPSYIMFLAKKTSICKIFEKTPQQSDYECIRWNTGGDSASSKIINRKTFKRLFPKWFKDILSKKLFMLATLIRNFKETGSGKSRHFLKPN